MQNSKYGSFFSKVLNEEILAPRLQAIIGSGGIAKNVLVENKIHDSVGDDYFHPSIHCSPGARQLYFNMHPATREQTARRKKTYTDVITPYMGTSVHAILQQTLIDNDVIPAEDIEVSLVDNEHGWRGHMDLIYQGVPVDLKTINSRGFSDLKVPSETYQQQLNCYMDYYKAPFGIILYFELGYPFAMKEFRVDRNETMLNDLYHKWDYVRESIALNTPPAQTCCNFTGNAYKWCGAKTLCESDLNAKREQA